MPGAVTLMKNAMRVTINVISEGGRKWVNVTSVNPFGLRSSAWVGRKPTSRAPHRHKKGLQRQMARMLAMAQQHPIEGAVPRVVVHFAKAVTREVHDALVAMGCEVEGKVLEPPYPWQPERKKLFGLF
jgi:hypothetical protein